jgi:diguanylate cyclase (GGDEF)-like protein/PAS domain S-box-containing protein
VLTKGNGIAEIVEGIERLVAEPFDNAHQYGQKVIDLVVELTQSEIGYLHGVDEASGSISLTSWSSSVMAMCTAAYDQHYPVNEAGIWADCIRLKQPVIHNEYPISAKQSKLPEGHFPVTRHMSVPVLRSGVVVGVIGVGNRALAYTEQDCEQLQLISSMVWTVYEQKQAEEQLAEQYNRYRAALNAAKAGAFYFHLPSGDLKLSESAKAMFGFPSNQEVFQFEHWQQLLHPLDADRAVAEFSAAVENSQYFEFELKYRVVIDGLILYLRSTGEIKRDSQGVAIWVMGLNIDETQQQESLRQLHLSHEIFENLSHGLVITDAQGFIIDVNRAFSRISGYSRSEALGKNPHILSAGEHDGEFYKQLWASLETHGRWSGEFLNRKKDGQVYIQRSTINRVENTVDGGHNFIGLFYDATSEKALHQQLRDISELDALTGLPNRETFIRYLSRRLNTAKRESEKIALLFINLDFFKQVNDSYGHRVGDLVIKQSHERIESCLRDADFLARVGGDEFVIVFEQRDDITAPAQIASRVIKAISLPFEIESKRIDMTASIGISVYPDDSHDPMTLMSFADSALALAKANGRDSYQFFSLSHFEEVERQIRLKSDIARGIYEDEFVVHFQPQFDIRTGRMRGCEALVRWQHPERGLLYPGDFIETAESHSLMEKLGYQILLKACTGARPWLEAGLIEWVSVNVSERQFKSRNLIRDIEKALDQTGVLPSQLEVEIVERCIIDDSGEHLEQLTALRQRGIHIAIDDFGTGYSSLYALKSLPVTCLKVDKKFVDEMAENFRSWTVAHSIVSMANALGLRVVAEGIETEKQREALRRLQCPLGQGYLYSKAIENIAELNIDFPTI